MKAVHSGLSAVTGLLQRCEDTRNVLQEQLSGSRQSGTSGGSHEKLHTQFGFQFLNCSGQRGLFDVQPFGRTSKVKLFGNSKKAAKMAQLHSQTFLSLSKFFEFKVDCSLGPASSHSEQLI